MAVKLYQSAVMSYPDNSKTAALVAKSGQQVKVYSATLVNRTGGAIDVAMLRGFGNTGYKAYSLIAGACSDITAALQAGTATGVFDTTNNDGFVIEAKEPFSLIGLTVSQAESGSPVYAFQYWNGSGWAAVTAISVPTAFGTGTQLMFFLPPIDWAVGGTGITGADATKYHIQAIATTAPGQAVKATKIWVGQLLGYQPSAADKSSTKFTTFIADDRMDPLTFESGDYVLPYFGGTKNAANVVQVEYLINY